MTKNQQLLLGVGIVGVAGYLYWKSKQPKAAFASVNYVGANAKRASLNGIKLNGDGPKKIAGQVLPLGDRKAFGKKAGFANQKTSGDGSWAGVDSSKSGFFKVKDKGWVNGQ